MEKSIEMLWSKLDDRLKEQTATITTAVTQNIMEAIDEKLKNLSEENTILKTKISTLEQKLANNEREKRKQNLVFFGVQEQEKSELELVDYIKEIVIETGTQLESHEITKVHRKQLTEVKNGNKKEKYTLSDTTKQLIEERKNLLSSRKRNAKLITDLSKQIKENIRKDRRSRRMQTLEKHIIRTGGVKKALKDLKEKYI
ncbi:hypothetical protein SFRURICE_008585 [Spodoptera frugiperda]|nr:hypothetical protein SFRURICE_008585 [Spodoptera frugiperda]